MNTQTETTTQKAARLIRFPLVMCVECERVFDLTDEWDADEWYNGHDCES